MIDVNSKDIIKEFNILQTELKQYNKDLILKPSALFITKIDAQEKKIQSIKLLSKKIDILKISSISKENISKSIDMMYKKLHP